MTQTVHVVFKTHLDMGFTDYAAKVVDAYFLDFMPRAIRLATQLRQQYQDRTPFRWTVGSWLIYQYLEQAAPAARAEMEAAIIAGDIIWHAMPFTTHSEAMDVPTLQYGLGITARLDQRFGKQTIAAKMTDVPGHTIGIVPLFAQAGIRLLHIGVNEASSPPDVPPVFVWRHEPTATELLVIYESSYGNVTTVSGLDDALAIIFTGDNIGPPTAEMVATTYQRLEERFPGANLIASSLDTFTQRLLTIRAQLPVITSEIGDTWIQGLGTDPTKMRHHRAIGRLLATGGDVPTSNRDPLHHALLLTAEHTWGMDEKIHLADYTHYENAELAQARKTEHFQRFEASWQEQREYLRNALQAIDGSELATAAQQALAAVTPVHPVLDGYTPYPDNHLQTTHFDLTWDRENGALIGLRLREHNRKFADPAHPIGTFTHQVFSEQDYQRYWQQYIRETPENLYWAKEDNTKPGMPAVESNRWQAAVSSTHYRQTAQADHVLLQLSLPADAYRFGAPQQVWLEYSFPFHTPQIDIRLQWFEKTACRLPEAFWFSFAPAGLQPEGWLFEKLGQMVSPLDVISKGARHLHAIERGVFYQDQHTALQILSPDVPLVSPGKPSLLDFHNQLPEMDGGVHFNLYNNVWGTNFPMWFEDDALFRFSLIFASGK